MKIKFPVTSIILMLIFLIGGTVIIAIPWPKTSLNVGIGELIIGYFGYIYVIAGCWFYAYKGK